MLRLGVVRSALSGLRRPSVCRNALQMRHSRGLTTDGDRGVGAGHGGQETGTRDEVCSSDARHKEFSERFVAILRAAKIEPSRPTPDSAAVAEADKQLAEELRLLFRDDKVEVTPELLERRKKLREEYPELFRGISDSDLDG
ncbi:hypothetical protein LPJ61_002328 [Coemansia biformis]|uniref:Uncharacterized protein n=1 Tax=Coemansia biformis TaxID=1286918 RepID=A0A9W8CYR9_9FUNG|nr:hypothetical protein LPJ61_002328 [Coemansia biformis]